MIRASGQVFVAGPRPEAEDGWADPAAQGDEAPAGAHEAGAEEGMNDPPRRILLIEDSPSDRHLARSQLAIDNAEYLEAADGVTGLGLARDLQPDLILLDVRLPGWDGFETLRHLKDDPLTRAIPVIFVSGGCTSNEKARGLDLGATDFVAKPFDPIELQARVRVALRTKELQDLLEQRAHLDGLTGLNNRLALEERLASEWALCRRRGHPLTVLIADIDHFKAINDLHGHWAGDEVLRRVAGMLRTRVRGGDFVARYGGEEFVILAADCGLAGGVAMAERFRGEIAAMRLAVNGRPIPVTASLGVASAGADEHAEAIEVLCAADQALYQSKRDGRNTVRFWDRARSRALPATELPGREAEDEGREPAVTPS